MQNEGRLDEAIACYRRAIDADPDLPDAHSNLGVALRATGRVDEAVACYRTAIALRPDYPEAHNNLGIALQQQGLLDEAVACFREAVALKPDYPDGHGNLGMALLLRGELPEGWAEYEWRLQTPKALKSRRSYTQPQWRGEPAEGRTLLVHAEQGFGDTLHFCRYAALAAARGLRVLSRSARAAGPASAQSAGRCAGRRVGRRVAAVRPALPDAQHAAGVRNHAGDHPRTTFPICTPMRRWPRTGRRASTRQASQDPASAWFGRATRITGGGRLAPEQLAPLFALTGLHFVSLQKDGPAAAAEFGLTDLMAEVADYADTAALIANLDLVISVDTSVAHLAAALGKPVWLMDRFDPDWRWLLGRSDSPWYPTLRIFRQPRPGDWTSVVESVRAELASHQAPPPREGLRSEADQGGEEQEPLSVPSRASDLGANTAALRHAPTESRERPDDPVAHVKRAIALSAEGRLDEANASYRTAISLDPTYAMAHNNLGNILRLQGRLDEAIASLRTAADLKPDYAEVHEQPRHRAAGAGLPDEAAACCRRAIALRPDYPEAHTNLGDGAAAARRPGYGWQENEWRWQTPHTSQGCRTTSTCN